MKKMISILSLMLMMAMSRGFAADACGDAPKGADDKAVESKAKELLAGKITRLDKISAAHAFVRDEISQAKTQSG